MKPFPEPLNLCDVRVLPLAQRDSLSSLKDIFLDPDSSTPPCSADAAEAFNRCVDRVRAARDRKASVILMYGAHLVKNGGMGIVNQLLAGGWITHLATNGAGSIHDWEFAFLGRTEEDVRKNVATGRFGTWDETGKYISLALLAGGLNQEGYGRSLGRFIEEDGTVIPTAEELQGTLRSEPGHPGAAARADLLQALRTGLISPGRLKVEHPWKASSLLAETFRRQVPMTVHPGIGYDIIATHPLFSGAAVGRAAAVDFALFSRAVESTQR